MADAFPTPPSTPPATVYNEEVVKTLINTIIETGGPSFFTGHARFPSSPDDIPEEPAPLFKANDMLVIYLLVASRNDREAALAYIYSRLPDHERLLFQQVANHQVFLSFEDRTRLVLLVFLGFMAFYHTRPFSQDLRQYVSLQNVLTVMEISVEPPNTRGLTMDRVSVKAPSGKDMNYGRLAIFHYMDFLVW